MYFKRKGDCLQHVHVYPLPVFTSVSNRTHPSHIHSVNSHISSLIEGFPNERANWFVTAEHQNTVNYYAVGKYFMLIHTEGDGTLNMHEKNLDI